MDKPFLTLEQLEEAIKAAGEPPPRVRIVVSKYVDPGTCLELPEPGAFGILGEKVILLSGDMWKNFMAEVEPLDGSGSLEQRIYSGIPVSFSPRSWRP